MPPVETELVQEARSRAHVEFYGDKEGEWRWRVQAPNGRVVADSGHQGYGSEGAAIKAFLRAVNLATEARDDLVWQA